MKRYHYKIVISVDIGKVVEGVGTILNEVNSTMENFGFKEKLIVRGNILECTLKTGFLLNKEQKAKIKEIIIEQLNKAFAYDAKIETFDQIFIP